MGVRIIVSCIYWLFPNRKLGTNQHEECGNRLIGTPSLGRASYACRVAPPTFASPPASTPAIAITLFQPQLNRPNSFLAKTTSRPIIRTVQKRNIAALVTQHGGSHSRCTGASEASARGRSRTPNHTCQTHNRFSSLHTALGALSPDTFTFQK